MSVFRYPTYKIRIAPDSQKTQGLQAGDIIRRQYAERERTVYSLMCVTETGTELVGDKDAPYFIGALLDGDEPQGGELLDFVRITNLFDTARSGALYLTASDSDSPYMDVIDGMATERSLCYPVMDGGMAGVPDKSRYAVYGSMLQTEYLDAVRPAHTAGFGAADDLPHQTDLQRGKMGNCSFQHPLREIGKALVQPVQLPFENRHQIFRFKIVVPWLHQIGVLPQ